MQVRRMNPLGCGEGRELRSAGAGVAPTAILNSMRRCEKAEVAEKAWAKRSGGCKD